MTLKAIIYLVIALQSGLVLAQPPSDIPEPQFTRAQLPHGDSELGLGFFLGAGDYSILSMPIMENADSRVDGSRFQDDVRNNRGSSIGLNLNWRLKKYAYPLSLTGHWLRVATAPGTGIPTPASYSRLSLNLGSSLGTGLPSLAIEPSAEARRTMFLNVDSGHYIDSIHLRTKVVAKIRENIAMSVFYSYAPWTKFGLLQGSGSDGSGALTGTTTTVNEFGSSLTWSTAKHTDLILAYQNERSTVKLDSTDSYSVYGLPVTDDPILSGPKTFHLNMRQVIIGSQTHF
ncbi:MAG: hypothetical protein WCL28_08065 [bacterium]